MLIVSGNPDTQDAYVRFLRDLRIPVVGLDTVDDASVAIGYFPVRAALFDVAARDDWDSCRRLRDRLPSSIPVIALTAAGSADGDGRRLARRIGCAELLAKPCPPEMLVNALDRTTDGGLSRA